MDKALKDWNTATGNLPYGVQRVFLDTLNLVKDEKIHLVWGADYRDSKPCLVNAVASMLTTGGGHGIPMRHYGKVVSQFDQINAELRTKGINTDGYVSPLAAEILIRNFGELKPEPEVDTSVVEMSNGAYVEPSDEEVMQDWLNSMKAPSKEEIDERAAANDNLARFAKDYIERT